MATLSSPSGIVAVAAAAVALVALVVAVVAVVRLRALRAGQTAVLGESGERDLVAHAAELSQAFQALRDYVETIAEGLDGRVGDVDARLRRAFAHRALVRYDAYNEMSGHQSLSIALLDKTRSGIVLTSIHHRDQARLYAKQVHEGTGELELSPEEAEAVRLALESPA